MAFLRFFGYLWALPATAVGLLFVLLAWLSGGTVQVVQGVLEVQGGWVTAFLRRRWLFGPASARTIGHVILGQDQAALDQSRCHEQMHVRQYERWGPLLLPAYLIASLSAYLRGGDPYWDNAFEREAYAREAQERMGAI